MMFICYKPSEKGNSKPKSKEEVLEQQNKEEKKTKEVHFTVGCSAVYHSHLTVNADLTQEEVLKYIQDHLSEAPVNDLEWLNDDEAEEAVTMTDIRNIDEFRKEEV